MVILGPGVRLVTVSTSYLTILHIDMTAWFYILRLQSGALYIGATTDLEKRYAKHRVGAAGRITSLDLPISLVYSEEHDSVSAARQREAQVKRWSRAKMVTPSIKLDLLRL